MEAAESLPHAVNPDASGRFVMIPDKGLDCVFVFHVDPSGALSPADPPFVPCGAGSGPRHAAFHPHLPIFYVVAELDCSVQSFHWDATAGRLDPLQTVSTLPPGGAPGSFAAEIAISADGRSLYASNRWERRLPSLSGWHNQTLLSPRWRTILQKRAGCEWPVDSFGVGS